MEIIIFFIRIYQKTISQDHGMIRGLFPYGYCKFHPTCSEYAVRVLRKDGISGFLKIVRRIIKCRPGTEPAVDLP
jgi:putative membrane protein insertion efficiency factor